MPSDKLPLGHSFKPCPYTSGCIQCIDRPERCHHPFCALIRAAHEPTPEPLGRESLTDMPGLNALLKTALTDAEREARFRAKVKAIGKAEAERRIRAFVEEEDSEPAPPPQEPRREAPESCRYVDVGDAGGDACATHNRLGFPCDPTPPPTAWERRMRSLAEPAPPPQEPSSEALELADKISEWGGIGNRSLFIPWAARLIDAWAARREKIADMLGAERDAWKQRAETAEKALETEKEYAAEAWRNQARQLERAEAAEKVIADLRTEAGRAAFATSNNWPLPEELRAAEARAAHYEELLEAALMSVLEDGDYLYKEITEALRR